MRIEGLDQVHQQDSHGLEHISCKIQDACALLEAPSFALVQG